MSSDVPRYGLNSGAALPSAPRRAVLQSISAQDSMPVQRRTSYDADPYKISENKLQADANQAAQSQLRTHTSQRRQFAPLTGVSNIVAAAQQPADGARHGQGSGGLYRGGVHGGGLHRHPAGTGVWHPTPGEPGSRGRAPSRPPVQRTHLSPPTAISVPVKALLVINIAPLIGSTRLV